MRDPLGQLRLRFAGLRLVRDGAHIQVYAGKDFSGNDVTVVMMTEDAGADPESRTALSNAATASEPTVVASDFHVGRPWVAIREAPDRAGLAHLLAGLGGEPPATSGAVPTPVLPDPTAAAPPPPGEGPPADGATVLAPSPLAPPTDGPLPPPPPQVEPPDRIPPPPQTPTRPSQAQPTTPVPTAWSPPPGPPPPPPVRPVSGQSTMTPGAIAAIVIGVVVTGMCCVGFVASAVS